MFSLECMKFLRCPALFDPQACIRALQNPAYAASFWIGLDLFWERKNRKTITHDGGHLKPVTLKPVIRIFRIFRVFVSAFSAFSAFSALLLFGISSDPCFFWAERDFPHFPRFPRIGFESLISKIRPTGFRMTGLR